MSIRNWHRGKLIILWAWGCAAAALALTDFLSRKVEAGPVGHLFELLFVFLVFVLLSAVTWHWLGDRKALGVTAERPDASAAEDE
jgi:hypothetical protein